MPPIDALRRWLNLVVLGGWRNKPSIASSPGAAVGVGKLDNASRKGGMLSSCWLPLPGLIDLIPTMMMGTILPSPSSSSPSFSLRWAWLPGFASVCWLLFEDPNLNILKKLSGCALPPVVSAPSSLLLPLCLKAEAILPFCSACRKLSNVPSSPSPATFLASETALWSSPISEAAVAAAATESSRESIAA